MSPEWRQVSGWSHYEVSDDGQVRNNLTGKIIGQCKNSNGYMVVRLSKPRASVRVHRIVAKAFIPKRDGADHVNHLNYDRTDNNMSNLEWCTPAENLAYSAASGRMRYGDFRGKRSLRARLDDATVRTIRGLRSTDGLSSRALAARFGMSPSAIKRLLRMETYAREGVPSQLPQRGDYGN